ncbi:hypothetical protein ACHAWC_007455 [Mediolabrus comicus]
MANTRLRTFSTESTVSSKTHRRTSSFICNGTIMSEYHDEGDKKMVCTSPETSCIRAEKTLRAMELIRQLSFDLSSPQIIDLIDTEKKMVTTRSTPSTLNEHMLGLDFQLTPPPPPNTPAKAERMMSPPLPPNIKRESHLVSPPMHDVVMKTLNRARSTSFSEISDGDDLYATDSDHMMVMESSPIRAGPPNRLRLASDQSPYAVSSASSSTSHDGSIACSSETDLVHWHDLNLGINHVETSEVDMTQDDPLDPPTLRSPRLSVGTLQEWNRLCEEQGNHVNKRQYISSALGCSTPERMSSSHESVEEVHMLFAPPSSEEASLAYTHTLAPSTISISSEFHNAEENLSYSQSIDKSFESSLADDRQTSPRNNAHRRHKSDGHEISLMKKRPSHQRGNSSLDMPLESIPENLKCQIGAVAAGLIVGTCAFTCENSFESFVAREKNVLRKHRRIKSDGLIFRGGIRLQESVHVSF